MKVNLKQNNAIKLPEEFALLDDIVGGFYRYLVSYTINPSIALSLKSNKVKISVTKQPPIPQVDPIISNIKSGMKSVDPRFVVSSILAKKSVAKDAVRSANDNLLLSFLSDFTTSISNSDTAKFARSNGQTISLGQEKKFANVGVTEAENANKRPAILETPLYQPPVAPSEHLSVDSMDLIFTSKVDPASILVRQGAIVPASSVYGGITKKAASSTSNQKATAILSSLISNSKPTMETLPKDSVLSQPVSSDKTTVTVTEIFDIPLDIIGSSDFFLVFDLIGEKENILQRTYSAVSHSKNVEYLSIPTEPPAISIAPVSKPGTVRIGLIQRDSSAVGVKLYRKFISQHQPILDSQYVLIGDIQLSIGDNEKIVEDKSGGGKFAIYRAIPYGLNGILGLEFASAVTSASNANKYEKKQNKIQFASVDFSLKNAGIELIIKNIPQSAISMLVKKTTYPTREISYVGRQIFLSDQSKDQVMLADYDVKENKNYSYSIEFTDKMGHKFNASNDITVEYRPVKTSIINTEITGQKVITQAGVASDVTFSLKSSFIETDESQIKTLLEGQGLGQLFTDSLNKEKLKQIFAYKILRTNVTTGEINDLGILNSDFFSDTAASSVVGASPVAQGFEYKYSVTTLLRNPDSLLENYEVSVTDERYPDKSYTYKPNKWRHPIVLTTGTLVSSTSIKEHHVGNQFNFGLVGSINEVIVSVPSSIPIISETKASKINKKANRITWTVKGDCSKIDHFIVILEVLGMRTIVGKSHNISQTNTFSFVDRLTNGESGNLVYTVVPVFFNYERGKEIKTNGVIV